MPLDELATRLSIATAEVEGIERAASPTPTATSSLFRVGTRARGGEAPERRPAAADEGRRRRGRAALDRLRRLELRRRRDGRASRCPAPCCRTGSTLERRKVRGEVSDGMILAEDEVDLGADHTGIMLLPDEAEPGHAARRRAAARATTSCSSSRPATGPTCCRSTASRARSRRSTTCRSRRSRAASRSRCRRRRSRSQIDDLDGCPRYVGAAVRGRRDRAVAGRG